MLHRLTQTEINPQRQSSDQLRKTDTRIPLTDAHGVSLNGGPRWPARVPPAPKPTGPTDDESTAATDTQTPSSQQGTPGETFPSRKVGFLWYARWRAQRASRSSRFPGDVFSQVRGAERRPAMATAVVRARAWWCGCFAPSLLALSPERSAERQAGGHRWLRLIGHEGPSQSLPEGSLSCSRLPGHRLACEVQASPGGSHGTQ